MVDWYVSLSLQKESQRKPSNIVLSSQQKGDTQELKYCWNNMGIHTRYLQLTFAKSKVGHC